MSLATIREEWTTIARIARMNSRLAIYSDPCNPWSNSVSTLKLPPFDRRVPNIVQPHIAKRSPAAGDLGSRRNAGPQLAAERPRSIPAYRTKLSSGSSARCASYCPPATSAVWHTSAIWPMCSALLVGAESESDRQIGLDLLLRRQHVADSIVGHVELELPIGRQIGHGHQHFAALDRPRQQLMANVPREHAPGDRAGDDKLLALVLEQLELAARVRELLLQLALLGRQPIRFDRSRFAAAVGSAWPAPRRAAAGPFPVRRRRASSSSSSAGSRIRTSGCPALTSAPCSTSTSSTIPLRGANTSRARPAAACRAPRY